MTELLVRFLIGGAVVSVFAVCGDVLRPKSLAGVFSAAPSVAIATLSLTVMGQGNDYGALEGRSMIAGAAAFLLYAMCAHWLLMSYRLSARIVTTALLPVWVALAFALWRVFLR